MLQSENSLILAGKVLDDPVFSHESHSVRFMSFPLSVLRLSGTADIITVLAREELISFIRFKKHDFIELHGELRSFNNKTGVGNRLVISALAKEIVIGDGRYINELHLCGTLCKAPIYRKTPLGREICDLMLAINRRYGRADYLPCIIWGKNAHTASALNIGDNISIEGRIQSREYIKTLVDKSESRTTYEISISSIELL